MKTRLFICAFLTLVFCSCSSNDDNSSETPNEDTSSLVLNITGIPQIELDNISGVVIGGNYEAGFTESAQIVATNTSNSIDVTIRMVDNVDEASVLAIQPGNTLQIDATSSLDIYANFTFELDDGTMFEATSGSVTITAYGLPDPSANVIITSGNFNVTDGTIVASGTFANATLACSECGG